MLIYHFTSVCPPLSDCHFHNSTFTLGEKWSPDFDPESEGKNINYCIICECEKVRKLRFSQQTVH